MFEKFWKVEEVEFVERSIKYDNLSQFYLIRTEILKHPEMDRTNEFFDDLMYSFNTINWVWSNISHPFNIESSLIEQKIQDLESSLKVAKNNNYSIERYIEAGINQIMKIKNYNEAPLFDEMATGLDKTKKVCFVPVDISYSWLTNHVKNNYKKWKVRKPSQLRGTEFFDQIVLLGDLRSIFGIQRHQDKSKEFLLTAPRADKIYYAHYDWIPVQWKPEYFLIGSEPQFFQKHFENIFESKKVKYDIDEDLIPSINEDKFNNLISSNIQFETSEIDNRVDAKAFLLSEKNNNNSLFAFVESEKSNAYVIDDFDGDGTLDIWKKSPDEIGKGMFILRRTEGAGKDMLEIIADTFLGSNSEQYRQYQRIWKKSLKQKVDVLGKDQAVKKLKEIGCGVANLSNLNNWLSPESIRTRNEQDFYKILQFAEVSIDHRTVWRAMKNINAAHNKAGVELMKRLKEKIEYLDPSYLDNETKKDISLSEDKFGTVTAYLIEESLTENYNVPRSWTTWGVKEFLDG